MKKTSLLKKIINEKRAVPCPGAHDALSAKLIERAGFEVLQVSGFGLAATYLGLPDMAFMSSSQMIEFTKNVVNAVDIPVMADADTGFGSAVTAMYIAREVIQTGAAGMNIEDQSFPKRCGHMEGKQLISMEEMVLKLKACCKVRDDLDPDFVINARTDAIAVEGIEAAVERGNAYAEAGADMIFVEAPRSIEQIEKVVNEINAPVSINLFDNVKGGKTPLVPVEKLAELGVARVSIPVGTTFAAMKGVENYLEAIKGGALAEGRYDLVSKFEEFKDVVGYDKFRDLEKEYLPKFVD